MYVTTDYMFLKTNALRHAHSPTADMPLYYWTSEPIIFIINTNQTTFPSFQKEIRNVFYMKTNYNSFCIYHHIYNLDKLKYDNNFTL